MRRAASPLGPPRHTAPPITAVRGTVIASSLQMLRERGRHEAYRAKLAPKYHAVIEGLVATSWLPIDVLVGHYSACDALGISSNEIIELGRGLSDRVNRPILETALRLAGAVGVTPWMVAEQGCRLWPRSYQGGAMQLHKLGPKEARLDVLGYPCASISYTRFGWRGVILGALELFATRVYVTEVTAMCDGTNLVYRISWA